MSEAEKINPSELRIGNITEQGIVIKIYSDHFVVETKDGQEYSSNAITINPVPLTEEWLFKFGFGKYDSGWFIQVGNNMGIEFDNEMECSVIPATYRGSPVTPWLIIKYVHQLQNLYLALTGEELIIKP